MGEKRWAPDGYTPAPKHAATHYVVCWNERTTGRLIRGPTLSLEVHPQPGHMLRLMRTETGSRAWAEYFKTKD